MARPLLIAAAPLNSAVAATTVVREGPIMPGVSDARDYSRSAGH